MKTCPHCGNVQEESGVWCNNCAGAIDFKVVKAKVVKLEEEKGELILAESGKIRYKRGRKRGSNRTYIIRYILEDKTEKEIRVLEYFDTDVSFHKGDMIHVSKWKKYGAIHFIVQNLTIDDEIVGHSLTGTRLSTS
jgi:hypothetical protein